MVTSFFTTLIVCHTKYEHTCDPRVNITYKKDSKMSGKL